MVQRATDHDELADAKVSNFVGSLPVASLTCEMARVVAQLGHKHVPLRVQPVPVVGGVLVDTAM